MMRFVPPVIPLSRPIICLVLTATRLTVPSSVCTWAGRAKTRFWSHFWATACCNPVTRVIANSKNLIILFILVSLVGAESLAHHAWRHGWFIAYDFVAGVISVSRGF